MNREICGQCGQSLDPGWVDERVPKLESMLKEARRERDTLAALLKESQYFVPAGLLRDRIDAALKETKP